MAIGESTSSCVGAVLGRDADRNALCSRSGNVCKPRKVVTDAANC
jgi:hypothetical protein